MRFGSVIPQNLLQLEYSHYIYDTFDDLDCNEYRGDILFLKPDAEKSNDGVRLRRHWERNASVIPVVDYGIKIPAYVDTDMYLQVLSNQTVGWWKFKVWTDQLVGSPPFQIRFINEDSDNHIYIDIGTNNQVKLKKNNGGSRADLIVFAGALQIRTWYQIEITRDVDGNYQVWVDGVSKGTHQDAFLPTIKNLRFLNDSWCFVYIGEVQVNETRIV